MVVVFVVMVVIVVVVVIVAALALMHVLILLVVAVCERFEFDSLIGIARLWPALAKRQERETWSLRWPQVLITRWTWHILLVLSCDVLDRLRYKCGLGRMTRYPDKKQKELSH